jgi:hypothetical protein
MTSREEAAGSSPVSHTGARLVEVRGGARTSSGRVEIPKLNESSKSMSRNMLAIEPWQAAHEGDTGCAGYAADPLFW